MSDQNHADLGSVHAADIEALGRDFVTKYGSPGTFDSAGSLIAAVNEWLGKIGYKLAVFHRFHAAARNQEFDAPFDEERLAQSLAAGATGLLRGEAQYHEDVGTGVLGTSLARILKQDAMYQSGGDASVIGRQIPTRNRQNRLSKLLDEGRTRSILRAHYDGGHDGKSWLKAHRIIIPNMPQDTLQGWNKKVPLDLRETARKAGWKAARQLPLDEEEKAMEALVLQHPVEQIRERLATIVAAGTQKSSR